MFLLDTNVISELRKAGDGKADANVMSWSSGVAATRLYLSAITVMELELGILRLGRRDPAQAARLRRWMGSYVLPAFSERTLPIDVPVALRCAQLHVPHTHFDRDAYIAATALVHGMTVVTRNVVDFASTGVALLNPWKAAR